MPQTHNNDDIRIGLFSDYEVRVWVNNNYVMEVMSHQDEEEVGTFQYLTNELQELFWKEFNRYFANRCQNECIVSLYQTVATNSDYNNLEEVEDYRQREFDVIEDCWTEAMEYLQGRLSYDEEWALASEEWKKENETDVSK